MHGAKIKVRNIFVLYHTRHNKWVGEDSSVAVLLKLCSFIQCCTLYSSIWF